MLLECIRPQSPQWAAISREVTVALPWKLLYDDHVVVTVETEDDLIKRLNEWKD